MLRREVVKMAGGLFGLGKPDPSRFPYPGRPQPSPAVGPSSATVVRANRVIVTGPGGGIYVYSGPPASGNLIESIGIAVAGFDPFHLNAVLAGDTRYHNNGVTFVAQNSAQSVIADLQQATSALGPYTDTHIQMAFAGDLTATPILQLQGNTIQLIGEGSWTEVFVFPTGDTTGVKDTAAIQFALNLATSAVRLLPGVYSINAPIVMGSGAILRGAGAGLLELAGTVIQPTAGFSGGPVISFPLNSQSQEVRDISFDGSLMPASTAECIGGISASHSVLSVKLENLLIQGLGFSTGVGNPNGGTTWRGKRIMIHGISGIGFNMSNAPDSTWIDCLSLTAGQYGWRIQGSGNAKFIGCRAENSGLHGFYITGISSQTGGIQLVGCSTDGNTNDGVRIDMTGPCPVDFTDLQLREDGKAGAGNFSFHAMATATVPWSVNGLKTFPGTNGGSTGMVPGGGIVIAGAQTLGLISDAMVMAEVTPITGMTALNNISWRNVWTNTGDPAAPGAWTAVADSA